jgi:acyl dehydratase
VGLELEPHTAQLTRRDSAFYALSVGLGADPMDEAQLRFVDFTRDLVALPSMATVLAVSRTPLRDPEYGADYTKAVHGEIAVTFDRPLPVEGRLDGRARVTGIVDKGPGRGALVYTERTLSDAESGARIATIASTTFLRGDGGCGAPSGPVREPHPMPDTPPQHVVDLPTRPEQALYYRLNGDENALHSDPAAAARAGFPRPILHGLCTFGVVCHAIVRALCGYDPTRVRAIEARFSAPLYPGETIRTEIWNDGSFRARLIERDALVVNNGHAVVIPSRSEGPPR